ncbi:hypothetical protein, conserved [Trypanosoma brucei gambiense DAL972]|uniref:dolichol kinase n=1 Tax=Trypanosoma brucei gambiense (strain MHOM/CI/86/DAL972) TaxID=679716 RepID=C9ZZ59_TRYB9|nr:hypothetical protein, conserved [Trypanosoma brucei gambiense DAL972]CBH14708.1 hypothetical protein, conserved [Trypanosoma brucei gambiense DAL972]|eukprot:XP_011776974.1 hypothetical protein, conserved [Trypanosoma brucei gambiense DAL972]
MMIYPRMRVEVSYSATLMVLWALLLTFMSWRVNQTSEGMAVLLLTIMSVATPDGESHLFLPLLFLAERLLGEVMSCRMLPHEFHASTILSFMTTSYSHTLWKRDSRPRIFMCGIRDVIVWLLLIFIAFKDCGVTVGGGVFVVFGFVFYVTLKRILGESEAILVGGLVGFYAFDAVSGWGFSSVGAFNADAPNKEGLHTVSVMTKAHIVSRTAIMCAVVMASVLYFASRFCLVAKFDNSKSSEQVMNVPRITFAFWMSLTIIVASAYAVGSMEIGEDMALWLVRYITASRFRVLTIAYWSIAVPSMVVVVDVFTKDLSKVVRRKLFHFLAVAAFTPAAIVDPQFLSLSLSVATSLSILLELGRYYGVSGASYVNAFVVHHIDSRDSIKGVVRTHIYLIYGLGLSMMLYYRRERNGKTEHHNSLLELSISVIPGLVSLGVVDACAGIVGSSFLLSYRRALGRYLSNNVYTERANATITHKTTTGTLGGFVCGVVFWVFVLFVSNVEQHGQAAMSLVLVVVCSVAECFTDGIDNLQLPLALYGAVTTLFAFSGWGEDSCA